MIVAKSLGTETPATPPLEGVAVTAISGALSAKFNPAPGATHYGFYVRNTVTNITRSTGPLAEADVLDKGKVTLLLIQLSPVPHDWEIVAADSAADILPAN